MTGVIVAWHGTRSDHDRLDVDKAIERGGHAQHGPGLYLTSSLADALSYALPRGHVWRCTLDADVLSSGAETITLGGGIVHHVVTDQNAIMSATRHSVVQDPPAKLGNRERLLAATDPEAWNMRIDPPVPIAHQPSNT